MQLKKIVPALVFSMIASSAQAKASLDEIGQKAAEMSKAMVNCDWKTYANYVLPSLIETMGGRDVFVKRMAISDAQMTHDGSHIDQVSVSKPQQIMGTGDQLQAIVPMQITIRTPDGVGTRQSFLVASSSDAGNTWSFFDGAGLSSSTVKQLLPGADDSVRDELLNAAKSKQYHETSFVPNKADGGKASASGDGKPAAGKTP